MSNQTETLNVQISTPKGTATLKIVGDKIEIAGAKALAKQAIKRLENLFGKAGK